MITIFRNIFSKEPYYISIEDALKRIKDGVSKDKVLEIRATIDKEKSSKLKANLPSLCFSGKFKKDRRDIDLIEHSGYIILDFDHVQDVQAKKDELADKQYVKAVWVSPSGNGIKALIKIADKTKHREHFQALQDIYPDVDKSGVNPSRVCYESYDEDIVIKSNVTSFTKIKTVTRELTPVKETNNIEIFNKLFKWMSNRGDAFVSGERTLFIYKLASACCRAGISQEDCFNLCNMSFLANDNTYTNQEAERTIASAYKSASNVFGSASFENNMLVDKISRKEVNIVDQDIYDLDVKPKDVIFGIDVKHEAFSIYDNGYESAISTFIPEIDTYFKFKRGEITLLSGIGNYGKSTFLKYLLMLQVIKNKHKIAIFTPEENPASEFYHDLVEMYFGQDCTPRNHLRPNKVHYEKIYDLVSNHFFFVYPKDSSPTPDYVKERFLELIIKEGVKFCIIDPFNQLSNDYKDAGGNVALYLEKFLGDLSRFAQTNNIFSITVAHPNKMQKGADGNYPCPDVFDLAGGALWSAKMDCVLFYHLPNRQTDPTSTVCEFHSKKIRRRKIVGIIGTATFEFVPRTRRFVFNGVDYMQKYISESNEVKQGLLPINTNFDKGEDEYEPF